MTSVHDLIRDYFLKMPVPVSRVYIHQSSSPPQVASSANSRNLVSPLAAICLLGLWGIGIPAAQASLANPDANLYTNLESRYQSTSSEQFFATIQSGTDSSLTPASNLDFASIASAAVPGDRGTNSSDDKGRKLLFGGAAITSGIVVALFAGAVIVAANRDTNCCEPQCTDNCKPPDTPPEKICKKPDCCTDDCPISAPAPLPLFGVGLTLAWSRKFRNRMAKVPRQLA